MATKFEEIYCLNSVLKLDSSISKLPYYQYLEVCYKDLIIGKSRFKYDCHKDLDKYTKFYVEEFFYVSDGLERSFSVAEDVDFSYNLWVGIKKKEEDYYKETYDYTVDDVNRLVSFSDIPQEGSEIIIAFYNSPEFEEDLSDNEKTILAECMQIAYYKRMLGNTNSLKQVYGSNTFKIHSQAYQVEKNKEALAYIEGNCDDLIKRYSYRTAKDRLKGLSRRGGSVAHKL